MEIPPRVPYTILEMQTQYPPCSMGGIKNLIHTKGAFEIVYFSATCSENTRQKTLGKPQIQSGFCISINALSMAIITSSSYLLLFCILLHLTAANLPFSPPKEHSFEEITARLESITPFPAIQAVTSGPVVCGKRNQITLFSLPTETLLFTPQEQQKPLATHTFTSPSNSQLESSLLWW